MHWYCDKYTDIGIYMINFKNTGIDDGIFEGQTLVSNTIEVRV